MAAADTLPVWSVGLRCCDRTYLTAETFAFKINAKGKDMKKRQFFTLEANADGTVSIKSSLGRYLTAHNDGKVTCDAEEKGVDQLFTVEAQKDGRWAFKSSHGRYFGGRDEKLDAFGLTIEEDRLWGLHLAMHPQLCVLNKSRKRYWHLNGDQVTTDEDVPWGADATITLRFVDKDVCGKYEIEVFDGRFLSESGALKAKADDSCYFTLQFFGGEVAFVGPSGKFLSCTGGNGAVKNKGNVGRDEMFILEDSQPQFKFKSNAAKFITCLGGEQVQASQEKVTDNEYFQMEINKANKKWRFRSNKGTFWSCAAGDKILFTNKEDDSVYFDVEWMGPSVQFKASNGKYVCVKPNGNLMATSNGNDDDSAQIFVYEIINRPKLVLRTPYGFVALDNKGQLRCNNTVPAVFNLHVSGGDCKLSMDERGNYWAPQADGSLRSDGGSAEVMHFEFVEHSKMTIKCKGKYLQSFQTGELKLTGNKIDDTTLFEY